MDSEPDPRPGFAALGATPRCQSASVLNDRGGRLRSDAPSALICIPNRRSGRLHVVDSGECLAFRTRQRSDKAQGNV